jgi:aryl-alcohol dehydrogenase-like predicted oxidoreductase
MYAWQFSKMQYTAERHGWTKFVSMQNHYNLLYRENDP